MRIINSSSKFLSLVLVFSISVLPSVPAFAQLDVTEPIIEAPAPLPAPAPVVESAPVVEPVPEAAPTTEGLEPEVQTTTEVSAPSSETGPEVSVGTESGVTVTDTTAPTISGVADLSLGLSEATIVWTTDELATSRLEYGPSTSSGQAPSSYGQNATLDATALLAHTAIILNLTPNTTYYYCIHATDIAGNTRNSCRHSFATAVPTSDGSTSLTTGGGTAIIVDTTPPDISLVTVTNVSTDSVTINWTTDSVANAEVEYGTTAGYGDVTPLNTSLALNHSVTLTGLTPNTEYHYRIRSADEIGNTATTPDNTFTTPVPSAPGGATGQAALENETLLISSIETASITTGAVTITWQTDLPSDSQIEYGDSVDLGLLTTLNNSLTTSHSVTISNLSPNTNYIYRIKSKPAGAVVATVSSLHEFSTLSHSTPIVAPANVTSVAASSITTGGSTITWTTDKGATSQVEYGLNTSYGERSSFNSSLTTSHSIALSNLDPGTTYHYRVKSVDEVGNITFSDDHTFTTSGSPSGSEVSHITPTPSGEAVTPVVEVNGADSQIIFEINEENPDTVEDIVIERDGQVVYEGTSQTFTDTNLTNGHDYHYTVFARGGGGSRSGAVNITLAPKAGVRQVQFNESGSLKSVLPTMHFVRSHKKGDKDIEVEHLQEILALENVSFPENLITGYFGSITENALKKFQAKHGLEVNGLVDTATQKKLNTVSQSETRLSIPGDFVVFSTDLKFGDKGEAVKDLQEFLVYEGSYTEALVSGYFGSLTRNAVMKFQKKYNITPVFGYVGYKTRHRMQQLTGF